MNFKLTLLVVVFSSWTGVIAAQSSYHEPHEVFAREFEDHLSLRTLRSMKRQAAARVDLLGRAIETLENKLERRWGSGKYVVSDDVYHRDLKSQIISQFSQKYSSFASKCGKNPDFHVDMSGHVTASSRTDKKGLCSKKNFPALDLGGLITSYVVAERSPSPSPSLSSHH